MGDISRKHGRSSGSDEFWQMVLDYSIDVLQLPLKTHGRDRFRLGALEST